MKKEMGRVPEGVPMLLLLRRLYLAMKVLKVEERSLKE